MTPLLAEVAVIPDQRSTDASGAFFQSSIIATNAQIGAKPILDSYIEAIQTICGEGTSLSREDFHSQHFLLIEASHPSLHGAFDSNPQHARSVTVPTLSSSWASTGQSLSAHHESFFARIIPGHSNACASDPPICYVAIPIQRPRAFWANSQPTFAARTQPAACVYVLFTYVPPAGRALALLATFASRIRTIFGIASVNATSLFLDDRILADVARNELVAAYDGIGHALRVFVAATEYRGAIGALRALQVDTALSPQSAQSVRTAILALQFFAHAEGLGSLMRLHGWIDRKGIASTPQYEKILRCFHANDVEPLRNGLMQAEALAGYVAFLTTITQQLADRYNVTFCLMPFGDTSRVSTVSPGGGIRQDTIGGLDLPAIKTAAGDDSAVLMALSVGFVEPLRNAASYLSGAFSQHCAEPLPTVQVVVQVQGGTLNVYVGNPVMAQSLVMAHGGLALKGMQLVNILLQNTRLGSLSVVPPTTDTAAVGCDTLASYQSGASAYLWIRVHTTPLALYDFAINTAAQ